MFSCQDCAQNVRDHASGLRWWGIHCGWDDQQCNLYYLLLTTSTSNEFSWICYSFVLLLNMLACCYCVWAL